MQHLTQRWAARGLQAEASASKSYAEMIAKMVGGSQGKDMRYPGVGGLVAAFGKVYRPESLPTGVERGDMGLCYSNAGRLALNGPYTYVEGYAVAQGLFPMAHGWVTRDGRTAHDPTWNNGVDYFGIAFTDSFLRKRTNATGHWGVLFDEIADEEMISWFYDGFPPGALA